MASLVPDFLEAIEARDGGCLCHYCWSPLKRFTKNRRKTLTIDHIVPKSKGGTNSLDNLVLACKKCNQEKDISDYETFYKSKLHERNKRSFIYRTRPATLAGRTMRIIERGCNET